jgi:exodeoxyribonuclease VII large subunit
MLSSYSVADVTRHIQRLFETDDLLQDVWVEGEISNFRRATSGHLYFTLKDSGAQLRTVMWKSSALNLLVMPREGDSILAHGYISVYPDRGEYQLYADVLRPVGVGDLYRRFELLKAKLEAEGLFDVERKRPLPVFPRRIGIVTSATTAAFQDVLNVLRRRFPLVEVVLAHTLVQGVEAPPQIVRALERLNALNDIDVILVCRGGGSIEDLWAFNDEAVARAIVASRIPVISGVGHEIDFTIADFAADERAPTPSAAAEMLTPDIQDLAFGVERLSRHLSDAFNDSMIRRREALEDSQRILKQLSPLVRVRSVRQRIDDWGIRMATAQRGRLALLRERVDSRQQALTAANPEAILQRGYALVIDPVTGKRIKAAGEVREASGRIQVRFHDGTIDAKVEQK